MSERIRKAWRRFAVPLLAAIVAAITVLLAGCGQIGVDSPQGIASHSAEAPGTQDISPQAPLTGFKEVADYIRSHGTLPDNFITKKEAERLGWVPSEGNLGKVAPGKSIGGDRFGNREGLLPKEKNRIWYEADINYEGGPRGADRIVFSNDGLIYMTTDHYRSFTDITEGGPDP